MKEVDAKHLLFLWMSRLWAAWDLNSLLSVCFMDCCTCIGKSNIEIAI